VRRLRDTTTSFLRDLRGSLSAESCVVLTAAPALLTIERYVGRPRTFRGFTGAWTSLPWYELLPYAWWYGIAATLLFVVPAVLSWAEFRRSPAETGFRIGDPRAAWLLLPAFIAMAAVVVAVSGLPSFAAKYPLCTLAREDVRVLIVYELLYGVYFLAWEYFFRGWMLNGLARDFGSAAIWIQTLPFVIAHFGKPFPEAFGSLPAGLFLGWIAWRSESFVYGWLLHWGVAALLDVSVVLRHGM